MNIVFCSSFSKDLAKINNPGILEQIRSLITIIEQADSLLSIKGIVRIKGTKNAYRIRLGDYRIGIYKHKEGIELIRVLHRKDIYRFFP